MHVVTLFRLAVLAVDLPCHGGCGCWWRQDRQAHAEGGACLSQVQGQEELLAPSARSGHERESQTSGGGKLLTWVGLVIRLNKMEMNGGLFKEEGGRRLTCSNSTTHSSMLCYDGVSSGLNY